MNKLTAALALLLSVVTFSIAVAQEKLVIVSEFGLWPLAEYATESAKIDNDDITLLSELGLYQYCRNPNPNVVLLTSRYLSQDDVQFCFGKGVNGLVEYEIGFSGFAFVGNQNLEGQISTETIASILTDEGHESTQPSLTLSIPGPQSAWHEEFINTFRIPDCSNTDFPCIKDVLSQNEKVEYWSNYEELISQLHRGDVSAVPFTYLTRPPISEIDDLIILPVDGIAPELENFQNSSYPGTRSVFAYRKITNNNESLIANQWLTAIGNMAESQDPMLNNYGLVANPSDADDCPKPKCPKTGSCFALIQMSVKCCPKTGSCN